MKKLYFLLLIGSTISFFPTETKAQYVFNGNYDDCGGPNDEYTNAQEGNITPDNGTTCSIQELWADIYNDGTQDYFIMGVRHGNGGNASFRFYFNSDCNENTGAKYAAKNEGSVDCNQDTGAPAEDCVPVGGAEFKLEFKGNSNNAQVYEWNKTTKEWDIDAGGEYLLEGTSCTTQNDFYEIRVPVGDVFDPCDNNSCGTLELTHTLSNAGGSDQSNYCQNISLAIDIPVNDPPQPTFTISESCDSEQTPDANGTYMPTIYLNAGDTDDVNIIPQGDKLDYQWTIESTTPAGLTGTFSNPSGTDITDPDDISTSFTPDSEGEYVFHLAVKDNFECEETAGGEGETTATFVVERKSESECIALPVELINFSGAFIQSNVVELYWQTATESNNEYFYIERQNAATGKFEPIGMVKGSGNSTTLKSYQFIDENASKDSYYYRLRQVDFDNEATYSSIIQIEKNIKVQKLSVLSQNNNFILDFKIIDPTTIQKVDVYNMQGSIVKSINQSMAVNKGSHQLKVDNSSLTNGLYLILVTDESGLFTPVKVIKQ